MSRPVQPEAETQRHQSLPALDRLIVVAGPTSVGKSSFIRQMKAGRLPLDVQSRFPPDVDTWDVVEPKYLASFLGKRRFRDRPGGGEIAGLVYHYDTMRIFNQGFGSYDADPGLDILRSARKMLVADLRAPPEVLERHWQGRLDRLPRFPGLKRRLKQVKRVLFRRPLRKALPRAGEFSILEAYRKPGWLDELVSAWDRFLDELASRNPAIEIVPLRPVSRPNAEPRFELRNRADATR